jgi:hypothetical protein
MDVYLSKQLWIFTRHLNNDSTKIKRQFFHIILFQDITVSGKSDHVFISHTCRAYVV